MIKAMKEWKMSTVILVLAMALLLQADAYAMRPGPGIHVIESLSDLHVFDSAGVIIGASESENGGGGGVFVGPLAHWQPGSLPIALIGFGSFVVQGAVVSTGTPASDGDAVDGGIGLVFVPMSFFDDAIHAGYGWNSAAGTHGYLGFSLGHLIERLRSKSAVD